jgi:hypothetical protein
VHFCYGVEPSSQRFVDPPPVLGVKVRRSSWIPDDVRANCTGRVQLWPAAMPARQVFCDVVRTVYGPAPDPVLIVVPTVTVPGKPTLVTVSSNTSVEPEETDPKLRGAPQA